ncbi:MAG: hypothetical protein OK436_06225 [Thaumarchaeota archaeon]|nr:hypothetical protein [Nitrososphaerota archaeon]
MDIEALRMWSKHDQGHASTWLSLEDVRIVVRAYDLLKDHCVVNSDKAVIEMAYVLLEMEG